MPYLDNYKPKTWGPDYQQSYTDDQLAAGIAAANGYYDDAATSGAGGIGGTIGGLAGTAGAGYLAAEGLGIGGAAAAAPAVPTILSAGAIPSAPTILSAGAIPSTPTILSAGAPASASGGLGAAIGPLAAALAVPAGAAIITNMLRNKTGVMDAAKKRASKKMQGSGFLDDNLSISLPGGGSYSFGGKQAQGFDRNNPMHAQIFDEAKPIAYHAMGGVPEDDPIVRAARLQYFDDTSSRGKTARKRGEFMPQRATDSAFESLVGKRRDKLTDHVASYFAGAATQGATDIDQAKQVLQYLADKAGYKKPEKEEEKK